MKLAVLGLSLSLVALAADPADACSLFSNQAVAGEAAPGDVTPPQLGVQGWDLAWFPTEGTCNERVNLTIDVLASDSESPVGFVIEVVDGNLSQDEFGTEPVRPGPTSGTDLHFYLDYDLAAIHATLRVRAVDLAGNRSEPIEIVIDGERSEDEEGGGCAAGGGGGGFGALMLAALALVGARRRART